VITVKGWDSLENVDWTLDGKGLFVSTSTPRGHALLRVDLKGNARFLWEQQQGLETYAVRSPDSRHLAIYGLESEQQYLDAGKVLNETAKLCRLFSITEERCELL